MSHLGTYTVIETNDGSKCYTADIKHSEDGTINWLMTRMNHVVEFSVNGRKFSKKPKIDFVKSQLKNVIHFYNADMPLSVTVITSGFKNPQLYHVIVEDPASATSKLLLTKEQISEKYDLQF